MTYKESIEFLASLIDFERWIYRNYEFKLDNYFNFLEKLGNPHKRLAKVVLVAGTKGKGSTATILARILKAHGETVGLYTSPHLTDYTERIEVSGKQIAKKRFADIVGSLRSVILSHEPRITFFEAITTVGFLFFHREKTTVNVLEVGLGGRLDATNVTDPVVSVITRIGHDHTQTLGNTLAKIAAEKCGILREGKKAIIARQRPRVASTIEKVAGKIGAQGVWWGKDYSAELTSNTVGLLEGHYRGIDLETGFSLPLLGTHQIENAASAIAAAEVLYRHLDEETLKESLSNISLPSRIEKIQDNPTVILDMSHNAESAATLLKTLQDHFPNLQKRILLIGITRHKNKSAILKTLAPFFTEIYATEAGFAKAEPGLKVLNTCRRYHPDCKVTPSVKQGVSHILSKLNKRDLLVISGSIYVAGEALEAFGTRIGTDVG